MKIYRLTLFCILISVAQRSFCCECINYGHLDSLRQISYDYSDIVFLGELIDYDTTDYSFTFEIIEVYKGLSNSIFITGKINSNCSIFPVDKCKWIVYADFIDNDNIDIDKCLASRSELSPASINCYEIPPLPIWPKATEDELKEFEEQMDVLNKKAREDFYNEIVLLKKRKSE